jgi:hypothetical protein
MKTNKTTGEQNTETRMELAQKYFEGSEHCYGNGNIGIISLLSDLQHELEYSSNPIFVKEHYRIIINDIKLILIHDDNNIRNNSKEK